MVYFEYRRDRLTSIARLFYSSCNGKRFSSVHGDKRNGGIEVINSRAGSLVKS